MSVSSKKNNKNPNKTNKLSPLCCLCPRAESFHEKDFLKESIIDTSMPPIIDEIKRNESDLVKRIELLEQKIDQKYDKVLDKIDNLNNTLSLTVKTDTKTQPESTEEQKASKVNKTEESVELEIKRYDAYDGPFNDNEANEKLNQLGNFLTRLENVFESSSLNSPFRVPPQQPKSPLIKNKKQNFDYSSLSSTNSFANVSSAMFSEKYRSNSDNSYRNLDSRNQLLANCNSITSLIGNLNELMKELKTDNLVQIEESKVDSESLTNFALQGALKNDEKTSTDKNNNNIGTSEKAKNEPIISTTLPVSNKMQSRIINEDDL